MWRSSVGVGLCKLSCTSEETSVHPSGGGCSRKHWVDTVILTGGTSSKALPLFICWYWTLYCSTYRQLSLAYRTISSEVKPESLLKFREIGSTVIGLCSVALSPFHPQSLSCVPPLLSFWKSDRSMGGSCSTRHISQRAIHDRLSIWSRKAILPYTVVSPFV